MVFKKDRDLTYKNVKVRLLMLLLLIFGVASCSTKIAYNNLDWIASWYLDDYITLSDTQEKQFDNSIESLLLWHRQRELQNYVVQLKYIKIDLQRGVNASTINLYIDALKQFWDTILRKAEPKVMQLAYSLSDQQVAQLLANIEQQNIDKLEDFNNSSEQSRFNKRLQRIQDHVTSFTGTLTTEQQQLLLQLNQSLVSAFEQRIQFRREWANAIASSYQIRDQTNTNSEPQRVAFEQALRPAIIDAKRFRSDAYLSISEHNQALWADYLAQLIASLNSEQLANVQAKLDATIADLKALY